MWFARLLWWFESEQDVFYPRERCSDFLPDYLQSDVDAKYRERMVQKKVWYYFNSDPLKGFR